MKVKLGAENMPLEKGRYSVIEGTDGAGTTTQKELLGKRLRQFGRQVVEIAEPGGTEIGIALRAVILDGRLERSAQTNIDLFAVCRRELADQVIRPAVAGAQDVISDRNWYSSVAYQGFGEGHNIDSIVEQNRTALGDCFIPDKAVIIDVPVEVSEERIRARSFVGNDYFEQKGRQFFQRVRNGYLWLSGEFNIPIIDGTKSIDEVAKKVEEYIT